MLFRKVIHIINLGSPQKYGTYSLLFQRIKLYNVTSLFLFNLYWIIGKRQFSSDELLDTTFWNVRKTTIFFIFKANWCHPLFTKSESLFSQKTHSWPFLSAAIQAMRILPLSYKGNTLRIYTCKYHLICKVYNLQS